MARPLLGKTFLRGYPQPMCGLPPGETSGKTGRGRQMTILRPGLVIPRPPSTAVTLGIRIGGVGRLSLLLARRCPHRMKLTSPSKTGHWLGISGGGPLQVCRKASSLVGAASRQTRACEVLSHRCHSHRFHAPFPVRSGKGYVPNMPQTPYPQIPCSFSKRIHRLMGSGDGARCSQDRVPTPMVTLSVRFVSNQSGGGLQRVPS
jgi:hypothetical protein